jgi:hypothetical protein
MLEHPYDYNDEIQIAQLVSYTNVYDQRMLILAGGRCTRVASSLSVASTNQRIVITCPMATSHVVRSLLHVVSPAYLDGGYGVEHHCHRRT